MNEPARAVFASILVATALACTTHNSASESDRLDAFFEEVFQRDLARSPLSQSGLGIKTDQDKWNDISEERRIDNAALRRDDLKRLYTFDFSKLTSESQLSYELFEFEAQSNLKAFEWRRNIYEIGHRRGLQRTIPQTLINNHPIETLDDAEDYVARLHGVKPLLKQLVIELQRDEDAGTLAPRFDIEKVISVSRNLISGEPFDDSESPNAIWTDFASKIERADLSAVEKGVLIEDARNAMRGEFRQGFEHLIAWLEAAHERAGDEAGVWKLHRGDEFYAMMLERETTVPISAEEVHQTGLAEVDRIHGEMRAIMRKVGFEGELKAFFNFLQTDPQFYHESTKEGRAAYLQEMQGVIDEMAPRLPQLFARLPKAKMVIKRVEPWLEKSAGTAGYFAPSADGSRPGYLYVNLYDMGRMPRYEISSLAYHEGIPGHHLENAISQELEGLPKFRNYGGYTAFSEGWGLYAEQIPKEIGLYRDPYQDFGRLSMELMRAGRLVVDSGVHAKRWTREQAIAWLDENTPVGHEGNIVAVDRYITLPAQATSYEIGKLKMMALREEAKTALGERFDLPAFHDAILGTGPVPLPVLEKNIRKWIASYESE